LKGKCEGEERKGQRGGGYFCEGTGVVILVLVWIVLVGAVEALEEVLWLIVGKARQ